MSEPIRHHYIPIFYLKQWVGPDRRLCEYSRPFDVTKAKKKHPAATGYVDGLYTVPGLSPERAQFVEKRFMQAVDNGAAEALRILLRPTQPQTLIKMGARVSWARFLYSLIVRNPESMGNIQKRAEENPPELPERLRHDYDKLRGPNDPETFDEYKTWSILNPLKLPVQSVLPTIINSDRVIREIIHMEWTTADVGTTKNSMLTSDRPIIMTNGLAQANAHIVIPISPTLLFIATKSTDVRRQISSMPSEDLVKTVNDKVALQAMKYVYGVNDNKLRFVANRLGKKLPSTPLG